MTNHAEIRALAEFLRGLFSEREIMAADLSDVIVEDVIRPGYYGPEQAPGVRVGFTVSAGWVQQSSDAAQQALGDLEDLVS